jgi:hypothetical protein
MSRKGRARTFNKAPALPTSACVQVDAGHKDAADVGTDHVFDRIKSLR